MNNELAKLTHFMMACKACKASHAGDGSLSGHKTGLLKCSKCQWAEYCDAKCQKNDWKAHKSECKAIVEGKSRGEDLATVLAHLSLGPKPNLRLFHRQMLQGSDYFGAPPPSTRTFELEKLWGLLATVATSARARGDFPVHPALSHKVARVDTTTLGETVVHLSAEPYRMSTDQEAWYPTSPHRVATSRLMRRILSDRWSLETALGISLAIREELYVTRGTALTYNGEKISDFGVCAGSYKVLPQDTISYRLGTKVIAGADPADHYWIYLTLPSGETTMLDVSLFVFNLRLGVGTTPYTTPALRAVLPLAAPGILFGRLPILSTLHPHIEREPRSRFSLLCYEGSGELSEGLTAEGVDCVSFAMLEEVGRTLRGGRSGLRTMQELEQSAIATSVFFRETKLWIDRCMKDGTASRFPATPPLAFIDETPISKMH